jgi:hypothetical protein
MAATPGARTTTGQRVLWKSQETAQTVPVLLSDSYGV